MHAGWKLRRPRRSDAATESVSALERWFVVPMSAVCRIGPFRVPRWLLLVAITVALCGSCAATNAGLTHQRGETTCPSEGGDACGYATYGWPWSWKTDAPESAIARSTDGGSIFAFDEDGYSQGIFFATAAMWFAVALTAEAIVIAIGWALRLLIRSPQGNSGTAGAILSGEALAAARHEIIETTRQIALTVCVSAAKNSPLRSGAVSENGNRDYHAATHRQHDDAGRQRSLERGESPL